MSSSYSRGLGVEQLAGASAQESGSAANSGHSPGVQNRPWKVRESPWRGEQKITTQDLTSDYSNYHLTQIHYHPKPYKYEKRVMLMQVFYF